MGRAKGRPYHWVNSIVCGAIVPMKGLWARQAGMGDPVFGLYGWRSRYGHFCSTNEIEDHAIRPRTEAIACDSDCETLQTMAPPGSRLTLMHRGGRTGREICASDPDAPILDYPKVYVAGRRDRPDFGPADRARRALMCYFSLHTTGIIQSYHCSDPGDEKKTEAYWEGKWIKARNTSYHNAVRRMWGRTCGITAFSHAPGPAAHQKTLPAKPKFQGRPLGEYTPEMRQYMYAVDFVLNKSVRLQNISAMPVGPGGARGSQKRFKKLTLGTFEKAQHGPYAPFTRYTNPTIHTTHQY